MIQQLNITHTDKVLDFCTGTASFLMEAGKYTKHLYGCENNEHRYTLAKCNFILNDFDTNNLKYNSCFNEQYRCEYDKIIINPPFAVRCVDDECELNTLNWKLYTSEQKFMVYALELLKPEGYAAFIVPRSNISANQ